MVTILQVIGFAKGGKCPIAGQYLKSFDHDAFNGSGWGEFTHHVEEAMKFETPSEAYEFWRKTSRVRPLREDYRPNKPLTSTSVTMIEV